MYITPRLARTVLSILLFACVIVCRTNAFFGFTDTKTQLPKSSKTGCVSWRQTKNCDGHGERDPAQDLGCSNRVQGGRSGYCECVFGYVGRTGCQHRAFTCDQMCSRGFDQMNSDESLDDLLDNSVWMWNSWREVKFLKDGAFWAPTPECEMTQNCQWKVRSRKIFVWWGNEGLHTIRPADGNKKLLEGQRYDGQKVSAQYIRKEGSDSAGLTGQDEGDEDDLYELMGVDVDASEGDIRKAYRQLSRELHPDKVNDPEKKKLLEAKFIKLQEAYGILKEDDMRMVYDTGGMEAIKNIKESAQQPQRGMDPFSMFFGGGAVRNRNRGNDIKLQMDVDLSLLYTGGETVHPFNRRIVCRRCSKITAKNRERCNTCRVKCPGELKMVQRRMGNMIVQQQEEALSKERCKMEDTNLELQIERGMKTGDEITFPRKNEQTPGQIPGDVIVMIQQKRHKVFQRVGENDLKIVLKVSLKEALTGVDRMINHLDGHGVRIKTAPQEVIYPKKVMRIAEEGMPYHNFPSQKGILLVEFEVTFPRKLTQEQVTAISTLF